jgi:UDP-N-acetylglucosamine--N-acetylmuramyl-(pentapeptide) pyrophosphoryl-undecaprenol N-acetylglucosamine transferase
MLVAEPKPEASSLMNDSSVRTPAPTGPAVVLAGGGTGGHISPGLAIAERLRELDPNSRPIFACSRRPIDASMLREAREEFVPVPAEPFSLHPAKLLRCLLEGRRGRAVAARLFADARVRQVVALGGFVTAPVVSAAVAARIPVLLVNLDATPGKANRWVAARATKVLSAVPTPTMPRFAERVIGMPIRRIALASADRSACCAEFGLQADRKTLLVTGASQGATSLNELLVHLATTVPERFNGWQVLHLCGHGDRDAIDAAYRRAGIPAVVLTFVHRIGAAWGAADLALSRAGANSVAEAAANGVPTVFAPYPYHKDLHQKHNAQPLVDDGAAAMELDRIDPGANADGLGATLAALMLDDARRAAMRARLVERPAQDAARTIAEEILATVRA